MKLSLELPDYLPYLRSRKLYFIAQQQTAASSLCHTVDDAWKSCAENMRGYSNPQAEIARTIKELPGYYRVMSIDITEPMEVAIEEGKQ